MHVRLVCPIFGCIGSPLTGADGQPCRCTVLERIARAASESGVGQRQCRNCNIIAQRCQFLGASQNDWEAPGPQIVKQCLVLAMTGPGKVEALLELGPTMHIVMFVQTTA